MYGATRQVKHTRVCPCASVCLRMHLYGYLCRSVTGAAGRAAGRREALGPNGQLVAFRLGTNGSIIYCKRLPVVRVFGRNAGGMLDVFGGWWIALKINSLPCREFTAPSSPPPYSTL